MTTTDRTKTGYIPTNGKPRVFATATIGGPNEDIPGLGVIEEFGPEERGPKEDRALKTEPGYLQRLKESAKKNGGRRLGKCEIIRPDEATKEPVTFLEFVVKSLHEAEYNRIRDRNTTYVNSNRLGGMRVPRNMDTVRFRSELIYEATVPDEGSKITLWDDLELQQLYGCMDGVDCVEAVLLAGEKDKVITVLETISGFSNEYDSEAVKN